MQKLKSALTSLKWWLFTAAVLAVCVVLGSIMDGGWSFWGIVKAGTLTFIGAMGPTLGHLYFDLKYEPPKPPAPQQ